MIFFYKIIEVRDLTLKLNKLQNYSLTKSLIGRDIYSLLITHSSAKYKYLLFLYYKYLERPNGYIEINDFVCLKGL